MIKVSSEADRVLVAKITEAKQDQVFDCWERLTLEEQRSLLAELHALNLPLIRKLIAQYLQGGQELLEARVLTAPTLLKLPQTPQEQAREEDAQAAGEEALRKGQIGVLTAAGEVRDPEEREPSRGMLPVGPVSGKTLFCLHAQKIRALSKRYRALPWIIVTSPGNHQATLAYFREKDFFGLNRADVYFLVQDELPVVNRRGKILLTEPGRIAMSPNGHGGVLLKLLGDTETFHALEVRGLSHLFYFQVDNPMARIAEPVFMGHHILRRCDLSSKTVCKVDADEKLGIFCQFNGSLGAVEYWELSEADRLRRQANGNLEFSAGNIAIHVFCMDFLRRLREERIQLPYHFVEKKTPYIDRKGNRVTPRAANSVQFQCFIFDTLPLAHTAMLMEARREEEFSPVKDSTGSDSAATAKRDLSRMYMQWLKEAGAEIISSVENEPGPFEISPLYALDREELKAKLETPLTVGAGFYLE